MGTIHIKSKLGITHFAHKYMETSHVASNPKLFKNFSSERGLNPKPSDYMANALPSELSGHVDIISSIIMGCPIFVFLAINQHNVHSLYLE